MTCVRVRRNAGVIVWVETNFNFLKDVHSCFESLFYLYFFTVFICYLFSVCLFPQKLLIVTLILDYVPGKPIRNGN